MKRWNFNLNELIVNFTMFFRSFLTFERKNDNIEPKDGEIEEDHSDYDTDSELNDQEALKDFDEEMENEEDDRTVSISFIIKQFETLGLDAHLSSLLGGRKSISAIRLIKKRAAIFFQAVISERFSNSGIPNDFVDLGKEIFGKHFSFVPTFLKLLETKYNLSASTIINFVYDLGAVSKWLFFYKSNIQDHSLLMPFNEVLQSVKKAYGKEKKRLKSNNSQINQIKLRRLPKNGLKELMGIVTSQYKQMKEFLLEGNWKDLIDSSTYSRFMGLLYSAMYTFSVQGRVGGIEALKYSSRQELLNKGYSNSNEFKTAAAFGYQPVILSNIALPLFEYYISDFRPWAVNNKIPKESDSLWISSNGEGETRIGRLVTSFFRQNTNPSLHITTTSIRSLIETQAQSLLDKGIISELSRSSVSNINGHSSAVAKDYYVQRDRSSDVRNAQIFFDSVQNSGEITESKLLPSSEKLSNPVIDVFSENIEYDTWGTEHPDYKKTLI
jgi:hypothetical protein